jgi:hypothetical protein
MGKNISEKNIASIFKTTKMQSQSPLWPSVNVWNKKHGTTENGNVIRFTTDSSVELKKILRI